MDTNEHEFRNLVSQTNLVIGTTGFDPAARRQAWSTIRSLCDLGKTVFLTTHYMDEAQHLADRLTILRAGEIVAQGTAAELSERAGGTFIRFTLPRGVDIDQVRTAVGVEPQVSGAEITLRCDGPPQHALYRLTGWAEQQSLVLDGLEVTRPTLDDVFLELTREAGA